MTQRATSPVSAVVLAAGCSARMGEAKQLLPVGERGMLERTLRNVRASAMDEVVLVLGFSTESIRRELPAALLDGVRVVINDNFESGMASSLQAGLAAISPDMDAALIVLADQPFVRPETMNLIAKRFRESDAAIVIPIYKGYRGNPVLLDRSMFPEARMLEGDVGCRAIFARHADRLLQVDVEDQGVVTDIDSREDYEKVNSDLATIVQGRGRIF